MPHISVWHGSGSGESLLTCLPLSNTSMVGLLVKHFTSKQVVLGVRKSFIFLILSSTEVFVQCRSSCEKMAKYLLIA